MKLSPEDRLIASVAYADVFGYPLTKKETVLWMLFGKDRQARTHPGVEDSGEYLVLRGRRSIVAARRGKKHWQEKKWHIAANAARWLSLIPTVMMVGVTGGLSMENANREDDIDLFCVASAGSLWMTRLLSTALMEVSGLRRRPHDRRVADKVCLNMFMVDTALALPKHERDCFAAHEVLQMQPIWAAGNTYKKFLSANVWAKHFLPNAWAEKQKRIVVPAYRSQPVVVFVITLFELPAKFLQQWYMRRKITHEVISDGVLRFHPRDARVWVKRGLATRLRKHGIPLDKVFYGG